MSIHIPLPTVSLPPKLLARGKGCWCQELQPSSWEHLAYGRRENGFIGPLGYVLGFPQDLAGKVEFWSSRNSLQCSVVGLIRHKAAVDTPPLVESEKLGA